MRDDRHSYLVVAGLITLVLAAVYGLSLIRLGESSFYTRVDAPLQDLLMRIRNRQFPAQPVSPEVALVGIDDATIKELGRFGEGIWKTRQPFIQQLGLFQEYQPSVVAYDIVFQRDEGEGLSGLSDETEIDPGISLEDALNNPAELARLSYLMVQYGDANLEGAFVHLRDAGEQALRIVFPYSFPNEAAAENRAVWTEPDILGLDDPFFGTARGEERGLVVPYLRRLRIPLELVHQVPADYPFAKARPTLPNPALFEYGDLGYIQVERDPDGVVRRYPLIWGMAYTFADPASGATVERRYFVPSLALLACLHHLGIDLKALHDAGGLAVDGQPVVEVFMGDALVVRPPGRPAIRIPIDAHGLMYLDYSGNIHDYANLSFVGSLSGDPASREEVRARLANRIVFVGTTFTGGTDTGPVPIDSYAAFVLVHMTAASNIFTQTFIRPVEGNGMLVVLLALWLLMLPCAIWLRPRLFMSAVGLLVIGYLGVCFWGIAAHRYVMPVAAPNAFLVFSCLGTLLFRYLTEEKAKMRIRGMFSTMVSEDVLQFMEDHPESFSLAGQRREATMFFSDVAGFTTISESLPPEKLVDLLNQYLSPMTEIVLAHDGFVDKYEGDAIMAEWGVPYPNPEHARLACWAALEQQRVLAELRPRFKRDFGVDINVRMGLNSGVVSAGNMGSERRFSYTVMGDAVNQAARFEPANKDYGTRIMIGHTTWELAREHIEARLLDLVIVKGKTEPIRIYELLARKGEAPEPVRAAAALYEEGLRLHWARQWEAAIACWEKALAVRPEDTPSQVLIERVRGYRETPPGEAWQGEYVRLTKD